MTVKALTLNSTSIVAVNFSKKDTKTVVGSKHKGIVYQYLAIFQTKNSYYKISYIVIYYATFVK